MTSRRPLTRPVTRSLTRPLALTLSAFMLLAFAPRTPSLRLDVTTADGRIVWSAPIARGDRFDLAFTHSSEHCRWVQHYRVVSAGRLDQTGSAFPCFGAGMPTQSGSGVAPSGQPSGQPFGRSRDGYEVSTPLTLDAVRMLNWRPAEITLRRDGREWPIGRVLDDYAAFTVTVRSAGARR